MKFKEFWMHSDKGLLAVLLIFLIPAYLFAVEFGFNLALVSILGGISITAIRRHLAIMDKNNR